MRQLLLFIALIQYVYSLDFIESIYKRAHTDTLLAFTSHNVHFRCEVAGVRTVTNALNDPKINSTCFLDLLSFQEAVPHQKFSPQLILHEYQTYHVEPIGKTYCKVMLNAGKTYAQKLLELGYAKVDEKQKIDKIYMLALKRSEEFGKTEEAGIWKKKSWQTCLK